MLQSFPRPRPTTNPYVVQLCAALPPEVAVRFFRWRTAILGRYDVLHLHWPENLLHGRDGVRRALRRALLLSLLARLAATRTGVVRTVHNTEPHESLRRVDAWLLARLEARTTRWVRLNPFTSTPDTARTRTVLHGHYRDWYAVSTLPARVPGRLLIFGLLRPYKGVEALTAAFQDLEDPGLSLHVVGALSGGDSSGPLTSRLHDDAAADVRIQLRLGHARDDDLVREIGEAMVVVLPYHRIHNSGAALLALSLGRAVLVPRSPVTEALADEVGSKWVHFFDGDLSAEDLRRCLQRDTPPTAPDLGRREWDSAGHAHEAVYRAAATRASARWGGTSGVA